ncbi:MAG: 4Fe-4S binding protein [Deltaproteobacteria bacterium]|nr:4Fe-4S binding protein [Deltaproteobacteria bacterium]
MAVKCHIDEKCIACGNCWMECPEEAIAIGDIYVVDPELCHGCSECAKVCPVDACIIEKVA